jgi:ABC-2 type transport system ATP-binding protein
MVHSPPILVLDEPTAGVDVELRRNLWAYVRELNRRGTTILLTTHYLEEAQEMCDRIAIIDRGRLVAHDTTEALLRRLDAKEVILLLDRDPDPVPADLAALGYERIAPQQLRLRYRPSTIRLEPMLEAVGAAGFSIVDITTKEADLQDIFLQLTGGTASAPA